MLGQKFQGTLRPVKYASKSFSPTKSRSQTTYQELFAVKWGLEQFRPYILGHQLKVVTDHANLKWLNSISPKQAKLARWCMSMAEYDFQIEHRPGKELVVPDTLSRAPLPCPSDEIEALIVPPEEVTTFLITAMGFDIPTHTPALVSQVFSSDLQCIALACDLSPPIFPVTQLPKIADKYQITTQDASDTCNVIQGPPVSPNWSEDLSVLHPLNISRTEFAKCQRTDKWLGSLFNYLMTNDTAVLAHLSTKDKSWVISTAKYCHIVDGLLVYADKLMVNPDRFRILVPNDSQLQRHFLQAYHDSPMGMHRGRDATYYALHVTFIGATFPSMSRTGLDGVLIVFGSNPHSLPMDLCKSACTSIHSTPLVLIMLVHCQYHMQEINGS